MRENRCASKCGCAGINRRQFVAAASAASTAVASGWLPWGRSPFVMAAEPTGPDDETVARELVREIDFTAKGAPRKTPLDS